MRVRGVHHQGNGASIPSPAAVEGPARGGTAPRLPLAAQGEEISDSQAASNTRRPYPFNRGLGVLGRRRGMLWPLDGKMSVSKGVGRIRSGLIRSGSPPTSRTVVETSFTRTVYGPHRLPIHLRSASPQQGLLSRTDADVQDGLVSSLQIPVHGG